MGKAALGLGQGGVAGEGLLQPVSAQASAHAPPSSASASIRIWPTTSSACTARSSRSSRTRAGSTCPSVLVTGPQRRIFKRAYITKILSERRKDEGLLRRMKRLSGLT